MPNIIILGVLSGLIFGALAMTTRRFCGLIVVLPIIVAPIGFLYVWRDALIGRCLFAHNFALDACLPLRELISISISHTSDAVIVAVTHLVVAFVVVIALKVLRALINDMDRRARLAAKLARSEARARPPMASELSSPELESNPPKGSQGTAGAQPA